MKFETKKTKIGNSYGFIVDKKWFTFLESSHKEPPVKFVMELNDTITITPIFEKAT
jgi:hypothetical protein